MEAGTSRSGKHSLLKILSKPRLTVDSETIKRVLSFPPDTNIVWRSHDESIEQKKAVDEARQQKSTAGPGAAQRRTSLYSDETKGKTS